MVWLRSALVVTALVAGVEAHAACVSPVPVSSENLARLGSAPETLLSGNPSGGAGLIMQVRDLAMSDVALVRPLLGLSTAANPGQASAIGTGLAQAAAACLRTDPVAAQAILAALAQANDPRIVGAFRAVAGDLPTFAVGGGGAAGGGGGGLGGSGVQFSTTNSGGGAGPSGGGSAVFPNNSSPFAAGGGSSITLGDTTRLVQQVSRF